MILVTGASGFVGAALTHQLDDRGLQYRRVSRSKLPGFVTLADPYEKADWAHALDGVEIVIHLAGRVHVMKETVRDPLAEFMRSNVAATANLARQAAVSGVRRFVYVSSIKVMPENSPADRAFDETDTPEPNTDYGISKLEAERELAVIARESGMPITVVRPPLVYGPGAQANFLQLAKAVHRGLPLPLGLVKNRRSMVFVENLVDFLLLCCRAPAAQNRTFMVSDGVAMSTAELVQELARGMGRRAVLLPVPPVLLQLALNGLGKGGLGHRLLGDLQVDISLARHVLGWQPPFSAGEGLARTVRHMFHNAS